MNDTFADAISCLRKGGVIAYPTEFCFGLGCDPWNEAAVRRILDLKQRHWRQGLIVIADQAERLRHLVDMADETLMAGPMASWPGPHSWLLPAQPGVPSWIRGEHATVAVRVTAHSLVRQLCREGGMALISTSANRRGRPPLRTAQAVANEFGETIDCIIDAPVGNALEPSTITDAATGNAVRG
ncbi:MAG: Sua5/YciO/YrdC/YwlC family protein [Gammaproteobacteria bacterium]